MKIKQLLGRGHPLIGAIMILPLLCAITLHAQYFEWASTGSHLYAGYKATVVDNNGNLVVAGEVVTPSFRNYDEKSCIYSSNGDSTVVDIGANPIVIVSYSPSGKINWMRRITGSGYHAPEVKGLVVGDDNSIYLLGSNTDIANFPELRMRIRPYNNNYHFIYCINSNGTPKWVKLDTLGIIRNPSSFTALSNGNFLVSGFLENDREVKTPAGNIKSGAGGADYLIIFDKDMKPLWTKAIQIQRTSCCSLGSPVASVASNGDIYLEGLYNTGAIFDEQNSFMAPVLDKVTRGYEPYESYVACYSAQGNLNWVKHSGGKSILRAITTTRGGFVIGGAIQNNGTFFGKEIDTTENKNGILASFDKNGNLEWTKTFRESQVNSLATDHDDNIYASVSCKKIIPYLLFGTDTIKKTYSRLIIASYSSTGDYRWVKTSAIPINQDDPPFITPDACGNIFISGQMFFTLKVNVSWFDAAFVKGNGYGRAPFASKLKNTYSKKDNSCAIIPSPWKLMNYPNPFSSNTTFEYTASYNDKDVSLDIYSLSGGKVASVFAGKSIKKGSDKITFTNEGLAAGVYIAVLKGDNSLTTTEIVIIK